MIILSGIPEALQLNHSVFLVALLFVIYHLIMKTLFYRPFFRALEERESQTEGKLAKAGRDEGQREKLLLEYETRMKAARQQHLELLEQARQEARKRQTELVQAAQAEAAAQLDGFRLDLARSAGELKLLLQSEIDSYARGAAVKILSRELSS